MSQVKPLHPCVSWPPPRATCTKNVSSKVRHFVVSKVPVDYPYHVSTTSGDKFRIPFYVIRGQGPPFSYPDFGSPGDVYLNLENPDAFALHLKTKTNWVQWHAAATCSPKHKVPISNLFGHPHFEGLDKFIWCDGGVISWCSRSTIKKKRRQMHGDGVYHREDGMTDDIFLGAVVARIIRRMLEGEEKRKAKTKRGMEDFGLVDDEAEPAHKKAKTTSQTPPSSDSMSVDSSLSSISHVTLRSPSSVSSRHYGNSSTPPPQIPVIAHGTQIQLSPIFNSLPPAYPQGPSSYESMSANQQLTMENAKLREEIRGRNFVDIGTSSKDKDLESLMSEPVGEDMASVTLPAPVSESFAASLTDVKALTALGLSLNNARLETQRIRLEMETKNSKADNEKEQLERRLSNALEQLEHQQHTTKAIQSLYDEANEKVDELQIRLLSVLNELGESNMTRLQTERKYTKLLQQMTRAKEALNVLEVTDDN